MSPNQLGLMISSPKSIDAVDALSQLANGRPEFVAGLSGQEISESSVAGSKRMGDNSGGLSVLPS
jgi:hypothetical protein